MTTKIKGYIFAAASAATYGTNPTFAVPLYADGMDSLSVLFFRYLLGLPILIAIMAYHHIDFKLKKNEIFPMILLGVLMSSSSLTLFESYNYMNSGIASTLLFIYPILVSLIMIVFFRERFNIVTCLCLILASTGIALLYKNEHGESLNTIGVILVFLSSLAYALYMVYVNVRKFTDIPVEKMIFYQLVVGLGAFSIMCCMRQSLIVPTGVSQWGNALALALFPTVISFMWTTRAIQYVGSTATAILGALEPLTAIVLGIILLGQTLTYRELCGLMLILVATTLVIANDKLTGMIRGKVKVMRRHITH